ncbi:MAG: hypothetical protein O2917_07415 [Acidobacteria bacterium]|nr:hypothetical protein [Acidobacteriota bacterium]
MDETATLIESLRRQGERVWHILPDIALALVLLAAGWLIARLARKVAIRLMRLLHVDTVAERAGLEDYLVQGGVRYTTVTLIAGTIYWLILLGVFIALLDALGLRAAGDLFTRVAQFVPNVLLAVGILVFGSLLSRVIGGVVTSYLSNVGSATAEPVGAIARYAMLVFVVFMAAEQVAIGSEVLISAFQIAFAAVCLAAALAFGLGGREWAAKIIERNTRK